MSLIPISDHRQDHIALGLDAQQASVIKDLRTGFPKLSKDELIQVMVSPPTPTASVGSVIGASALKFSISGKSPKSFMSVSGFHVNTSFTGKGIAGDNVSSAKGATLVAPTKRLHFIHTGSEIEFEFQVATTNVFYIRVDGKFTTSAAISHDSTTNLFYHLNFGSPATRRIELIAHGEGQTNFQFTNINISGTDTLMKAPVKGPRTILFGDSFGGNPSQFPFWFAEAMGWDDVWGSGIGGTGFIADSGDTQYTFRERLQSDAIQYNPQVLGFCGGVNDSASYADVYAEALLTFSTAKSALPNALIFCSINTDRGVGNWDAAQVRTQQAIRDAANDAGILLVDVTRMPTTVDEITGVTAQFAATAGAVSNIVINQNWGTYSSSEGTWANGATCVIGSLQDERDGLAHVYHVIGSQQSGAWTRLNLDALLKANVTVGQTVRIMPPSYIIGTGYDTATTGVGNSDLLVSSDTLHPSPAGKLAFGVAIAANLVMAILNA